MGNMVSKFLDFKGNRNKAQFFYQENIRVKKKGRDGNKESIHIPKRPSSFLPQNLNPNMGSFIHFSFQNFGR